MKKFWSKNFLSGRRGEGGGKERRREGGKGGGGGWALEKTFDPE